MFEVDAVLAMVVLAHFTSDLNLTLFSHYYVQTESTVLYKPTQYFIFLVMLINHSVKTQTFV